MKFIKNKKAFTLIELIVVIAVVGILVLLGMPRFIGHKDKAELARIQHDVKVMEQEIGTVLINHDDDFNKWEDNSKDFNQLIQENRLFEKEGTAEKVEPIDEDYKVIPEEYKDKINTKLKGTFYANNNGKVYYEHEKPLLGIPIKPEEKEPEYSKELKHFEFVPDIEAPNEYHGTRGYYKYVGDKEYVDIPHIIQDVEIKDYYKMFAGSNVKGVASDNKNVTDMSYMFNGSTSTTIELKYLDTSAVTDMNGMFRDSQATTLDLSSFNTSAVTDMNGMFRDSQATTLDLSSFNTSAVTDMEWMFSNSQATTLDLSSFDTSAVTNMYGMFNSSQATALDLSSFDTSAVTDMRYMFMDTQTSTLDLSSFDTSKVTMMTYMFMESQATTLDLSSFDTSAVTDMRYMFMESQATTLDLSSFDTNKTVDSLGFVDNGYMFTGSQATTGYARTTTDARRFNNSSYKTSALTFVVK